MFWKRKANPSTLSTGQWGEAQALRHLAERGFRIVATNYRKRYGEIDIIANDDETLVFIEVKCRSHQGFGSALEAVDFRKQQRICRVAMEYLQSHQVGMASARFDVIAVYRQTGREAAVIEHIENAFDFSL
ncbi:YraN family protein [Desulfobulbus propionicus]|jgi:putative endonuclease